MPFGHIEKYGHNDLIHRADSYELFAIILQIVSILLRNQTIVFFYIIKYKNGEVYKIRV